MNLLNFNRALRVCGAFCFLLLFASNSMARQGAVIDGVTYPANTPEAWLIKLKDGLRSLNYQLSFVVIHDNARVKPYLWRHAVIDGKPMEHLSLLNGPGSEIFRIGNVVSYFEPNSVPFSRTSDYINGPIPVQFFRDPLALKEGYDLVLVGRSRVSGRSAQQIRIVSKDASRYGITVWLDQESGLLLKMDTLDASGNLIEQLQVTEIKVTEEPDSYFEKIDPERLPDVINVPSTPRVQHAWALNWLPEGMEVIKQDVHRLAASQEIVEYVMVSDGLFDVSVYISKTNNRPEDGGWLQHESNTLFSINNGTIEVTVIGKIPAKTANAIATSIGPVNAG